jgi:predicted nuclease of predicted toxin-antitoxin system
MKFLIDMNLSPQWINYLRDDGHDAIHWSIIGAAEAEDRTIIDWAWGHGYTVLAKGLDFGAILALSGASGPSVAHLRSDLTLPTDVGELVRDAVEQAETDLDAGAVLTIEVGRSRVRILPFNRQR